MRARTLLIIAFVLSRMLMAHVTTDPGIYPAGSANATIDTAIYEHIAEQVRTNHLDAYRDVHVGYPPGGLALMLGSEALAPQNFLGAFVLICIVIDAMGLLAMVLLARRHRTWWPPVLWLLLIPALGPVAYSRLDLAVAASVAWAVERLARGRWGSAACLLGIGAAIKVTPVLLLPIVVAAAPSRWRALGAALLGGLVPFIPFLDRLPYVYEEVMTGNVDRGVHAESLWGSLALLATAFFGLAGEVVPAFGANDLSAPYDGILKLMADLGAVAVLVGAVAFAARRVQRGDAVHTVLVCSATFVLLTSIGRVFSPQYLVWLVPVVAASAALAPRRAAPVAGSLAGAVVLAHIVYPVLFFDYLAVEIGAVVVGALRHVFLLVAGVLAAMLALRHRASPCVPDQRASPKPV